VEPSTSAEGHCGVKGVEGNAVDEKRRRGREQICESRRRCSGEI